MMDRGQDRALLDAWLGKNIFVQYAGAPVDEDDQDDAAVAEVTAALTSGSGMMQYAPLGAIVEYLRLERYDQFGIEVRSTGESRPRFFLPWNAILLMQGPQETEEAEEVGTERAEPVEDKQAEVAAPLHDRRQELMDRLTNAQTATEVAVARGAADAWLAANPSDGDVRVARDQLPDPTGD